MVMKKKVLIALGNYPGMEDEALERLGKIAQIEIAPGYPSEEGLKQYVREVSAVILGSPKLTRGVISAGERLEVIQRRGIGVDNIDVAAASERGVVVTNVLDTLSSTVAEHTILLMLGISRKIVQADEAVRKGGWNDFDRILYPEISGKTLGILGFGSIGLAVARAAKNGFGMVIVTNDNPHLRRERVEKVGARVVSFDELLATADYLVVATPLTPETEGMIGERELRLMKPASYIINVARGRIINEDSLLRALSEKRIAGAALDVFKKQPPDPDDPLLALDNVLLTPHSAALTKENSRNLSMICVDALTKLFSGELPAAPVNLLNPSVAEQYVKRVRSSSIAS
jgi:D-3-phosphoglycerate dehydrogenase